MKMQNILLHQPIYYNTRRNLGNKLGSHLMVENLVSYMVESDAAWNEVGAAVKWAANRSRSWMETCLREIFDESVPSRISDWKGFNGRASYRRYSNAQKDWRVIRQRRFVAGNAWPIPRMKAVHHSDATEGSKQLEDSPRLDQITWLKRPHFQSN